MQSFACLSALWLCTCFVVFANSPDGLQARNAEEQPTLPTTMEDIEEPYVCIKRLQGRDGRDGRDGLPGRDGKDGEQGEKGERGPAGLHGNNGSPGERGEKGDLGETGPIGPVGAPGRDGAPGVAGRPGDQGEKGEQGEIGLPGHPGISGVPGERGRDGAPGLPGRPGEQGPPGPGGPRGIIGASGEKGEKGDRGEAGPVGPEGVHGVPGLPGVPGIQGDKGEQGIAGIPGLNGVSGPPGPHVAGTTYVRWGRTTCPTGNGTELLYAGRAAGSYLTHRGGGTNLLCLPNSPEYLADNSPTNSQSPLYGVEYHTSVGNLNLVDQNVPCAVCYTPTRVAMVMIPAWTHCPASWTEEYVGYIMTEYKNHRRIQHYCVDQNAEVIPGEERDVNGAMLHHVDVACNYGIPCPPYSGTNEVTCAVCTK